MFPLTEMLTLALGEAAESGLRVFPTAPAMDVTASETLGATVPEGPTAETCDRRDDKVGRAETGSNDA